MFLCERKKKALIQIARGSLLETSRLLTVFQSLIASYIDFTSKIPVSCFPHLNNGNKKKMFCPPSGCFCCAFFGGRNGYITPMHSITRSLVCIQIVSSRCCSAPYNYIPFAMAMRCAPIQSINKQQIAGFRAPDACTVEQRVSTRERGERNKVRKEI